MLTSYDGKNISYDAIGNPLNDGNWAYTWEHGRQLASMTNGTTTIDYEYNADGIRTKKTVTTASSHTHVFQSTIVAPTCTENGHTLHVCSCGYIYQDSPVAATGHTFTTTVVGTNCTEVGYTLKECACGYSYQEGSNGHTFTTLVVEPTETVNGFTLHECECGYSYESDPVESLAGSGETEENGTSDVNVYDYVYNGSSLTQLTITTTEYGESPVTEVLYFAYDGNSPMTVTYNGEVFYYVTNLQGDVIAILDATGVAVVEYAYDAWGNILEMGGSDKDTLGVANPLTYRGYVYDAESELYYVCSRYYDSAVGRFINADVLVSTGQGMLGNNMFAYCRNNPVCRRDTFGTSDEEILDCTPNLDEDKLDGKASTGSSSQPTVGTVGGTGSGVSSTGSGTGGGNTAAKNSPNPYGRKGGPAHQRTVQAIVDFFGDGYTVIKEHKIFTPNGNKQYRYADVYVEWNGINLVFQVGRGTVGGYPIAREKFAISDIIGTEKYMVCFVQYN